MLIEIDTRGHLLICDDSFRQGESVPPKIACVRSSGYGSVIYRQGDLAQVRTLACPIFGPFYLIFRHGTGMLLPNIMNKTSLTNCFI